jgi:hypothetical protein
VRDYHDISCDLEVRVHEFIGAFGYRFGIDAGPDWIEITETLDIWVQSFQQYTWQYLAGGMTDEEFIEEIESGMRELKSVMAENGVSTVGYKSEVLGLAEQFMKDLKMWKLSNYAFALHAEERRA